MKQVEAHIDIQEEASVETNEQHVTYTVKQGGNFVDLQGPQQGAQVFERACCSTVAAGNEGQLLKHDDCGPSTAQVTGRWAEIHGEISSVGFSTPEKACNFTKVSTPSSWADQVEEEERQEKERSTTSQGIPFFETVDVSMEIHKEIV
ncbi:hypothetical protein LIER_27442 [Lithospermum erythrorhizon]|uniref:Uncharacterized protein n=1 Tax=Lithospermum erythrorhizon TaxID=34254 RepID=A0AAV3RFZ2_LITER